jgi:hypothetical protein
MRSITKYVQGNKIICYFPWENRCGSQAPLLVHQPSAEASSTFFHQRRGKARGREYAEKKIKIREETGLALS